MKSLLFTCVALFGIAIITNAQTKIYVSDAGNFNNPPWQILSYDLDGSNSEVFIDEELAWPQDIVFIPEQNVVLISNLNTGRITKYVGDSGSYLGDFATVPGGPTRMKIGADGLLYVLQWSTTDNKVKRYELDGSFVDEFTSVGVSTGIGMDWDTSGNLYVSSYGNNEVRRFDTNGNDLGIFIDANLNGPTNIHILDNGEILVLNWSGGNVSRFDASGNFIDTFIPGLSQPEGIAMLPNGNLLIGNGVNANPGEVQQFLPNGTFVETTVVAGSSGLIQPNAVILFDPSSLSLENSTANSFPLMTPSVGVIFTLHLNNYESIDTVHIVDITGNLVAKIPPNIEQWDASGLRDGLYFVLAKKGNTRHTQKIIIQN